MTKYEYLAELERLLAALPEQERRDAMNYYEEYFVSAGPEKEAEAIRELGTPQQAAQKILEEAGVAAAPAPEAPQAAPAEGLLQRPGQPGHSEASQGRPGCGGRAGGGRAAGGAVGQRVVREDRPGAVERAGDHTK